MKNLAILLTLTTLNAFAHTEFVGNIKGTSELCFLHLEQVYYETNVESPENLRANIAISFGEEDPHHKNVSHGEELFFTIKPTQNVLVFNGVGTNLKDEVDVLRNQDSKDFEELVSFVVKTWHVNHFHSIECLNLKRIEE
jgi:hypothetical protein